MTTMCIKAVQKLETTITLDAKTIIYSHIALTLEDDTLKFVEMFPKKITNLLLRHRIAVRQENIQSSTLSQ